MTDSRTMLLAREIREARYRPRSGAKPEQPLRLPPLVGREQAWAKLSEAWRRRFPIIYVCGKPGFGKSRLMTEFAQAQACGTVFQSSAWAGDSAMPFASRVNTIRKLLRDFPGMKVDRRSRRQLGRIVPEMSPDADGLQRPDASDPCFVEANFDLYREMGRHVSAVVFDDGQYLDPATIQLGLSLEGRCSPLVERGELPPILVGIRPGELLHEQEEILRTRAARGQAAWIDVEPLTPEQVSQLMAGMGCPGSDRVAGEVAEYSGGSPYLILEIIRELVNAEGWSGAIPADFQLELNVRKLLDRKLRRLSPEALRVAQVIALVGDDLTREMLDGVCGFPLGSLAVYLRELERHHLVQGLWFSSGAVAPAVLEGIPEATRAALVERIADWKQLRSYGGLL